jgi:tetratricopeptide (TPR) repeat protein
VLYCEGEVMRAKRDYMQAIGFYEKAVLNLGKTGPADAAKFYFGLGDSYMKVGDRDNAIKAWQKARYGPYKKPVEAELMKTNPDFYLKLGISYFQAGEYDEANKHLLKAIQIQTDYAQAYRYLGLISDKRDLTSEAESYYQKAMQYELNPDKRLEIEISFLNMLMDNELFQKALTLAESILKEKPGNVKIMLQKAQAEYNIGRFSLAAKTIQKAITDPSLSDPAKKSPYQFVLGMALKSMGDSDGALEAFRLVTSGSCKNAAQYEMELLQPEVY